MATENKKEYWTDVIRKNPSSYQGKFIVHNETTILFASEDMLEVNKWRTAYGNENGLEDVSGVYLVPRNFGAVRLGGAFLNIKNIPDFIQF